MAFESIVFLLSGIFILLLIAVNIVLILQTLNANKKIDCLLEGGKIKSFKEIFLSQNEKNKGLEEKIKEAFLRIKNLEDISERTIQKVGVIRFNPFKELGGNQSFVIALLDGQNNGLVISSLFIKEGNRVYSKQIKNGKSEHTLSKEEKDALEKAIHG